MTDIICGLGDLDTVHPKAILYFLAEDLESYVLRIWPCDQLELDAAPLNFGRFLGPADVIVDFI